MSFAFLSSTHLMISRSDWLSSQGLTMHSHQYITPNWSGLSCMLGSEAALGVLSWEIQEDVAATSARSGAVVLLGNNWGLRPHSSKLKTVHIPAMWRTRYHWSPFELQEYPAGYLDLRQCLWVSSVKNFHGRRVWTMAYGATCASGLINSWRIWVEIVSHCKRFTVYCIMERSATWNQNFWVCSISCAGHGI